MGKKIAFIDRCVSESDAGENGFLQGRVGRNRTILYGLREKYAVSTYSGFDREHMEELKKDCANSGNYDSIITHLPYDENVDLPLLASWTLKCYSLYGKSLELLKSVHEKFPETKIIVYTGASSEGLPDEIILEHGASHVLRRIWPIDENGLMRNLKQLMEWLG